MEFCYNLDGYQWEYNSAENRYIPDYKIIPKVDLVCIQIFSSTKFPFSWAEIYLRGSIKDIFALFNIKK